LNAGYRGGSAKSVEGRTGLAQGPFARRRAARRVGHRQGLARSGEQGRLKIGNCILEDRRSRRLRRFGHSARVGILDAGGQPAKARPSQVFSPCLRVSVRDTFLLFLIETQRRGGRSGWQRKAKFCLFFCPNLRNLRFTSWPLITSNTSSKRKRVDIFRQPREGSTRLRFEFVPVGPCTNTLLVMGLYGRVGGSAGAGCRQGVGTARPSRPRRSGRRRRRGLSTRLWRKAG
jgi:hypothetical protein